MCVRTCELIFPTFTPISMTSGVCSRLCALDANAPWRDPELKGNNHIDKWTLVFCGVPCGFSIFWVLQWFEKRLMFGQKIKEIKWEGGFLLRSESFKRRISNWVFFTDLFGCIVLNLGFALVKISNLLISKR